MATSAVWGEFEWGEAEWGSIEDVTGPPSISVSEAITLSENVNLLILAPNTRAIQVSDSSTVSESVTVAIRVSLSVSDTVSLADAVTVRTILQITVSDSVTLTEAVTLSIPLPPPMVSVSSGTVVTEAVTISFGQDVYHIISLTGSLEAFSQFHSIRVDPAGVQQYMQYVTSTDIQKPTAQVIRTP